LAQAAERKGMSLREYLRFQVVTAARSSVANDAGPVIVAPAPLGLTEPSLDHPGRPAFLP
jgi:hypothetical protein